MTLTNKQIQELAMRHASQVKTAFAKKMSNLKCPNCGSPLNEYGCCRQGIIGEAHKEWEEEGGDLKKWWEKAGEHLEKAGVSI